MASVEKLYYLIENYWRVKMFVNSRLKRSSECVCHQQECKNVPGQQSRATIRQL